MSVSKRDVRELTEYLKTVWTTSETIKMATIKSFQKKQNLGNAIFDNNKNNSKTANVIGWEFSTKLTSYHRREIHTLADDMNLVHCSRGDARQHTRHIVLYCSEAIMERENGGAKQDEESNIKGKKGKHGKHGKGKKGKHQLPRKDEEVVQRAVQNALRQAAAAKQQRKSSSATRQQLANAKKKTAAGFRATLKNLRHLQGEEAEVTRTLYTQMLQQLGSAELVETTTEEDEALSEEGEDVTEEALVKVQIKSDSDISSEDESEDEDDLSVLRRKRPAKTGFAFSESDSESESDADADADADSNSGDKSEHVSEQDSVSVKPVSNKSIAKKRTKKEQAIFDATFLAKAAEMAKKEAALQKQNQNQSQSQPIVAKKSIPKIDHKMKLPMKRSERAAAAAAAAAAAHSHVGNTNLNKEDVKISEEDARRLAIMAAVAAARVEQQVADGEKSTARKATIDDILGVGRAPVVNDTNDGPQVQSFRKQVEHGPKKFIKP